MSEYIVCPHCYNPLSQSEYVKVIRCRDCVDFDHWDYTDGGTRDVCARFEYVDVTPDGFCAWAERREP